MGTWRADSGAESCAMWPRYSKDVLRWTLPSWKKRKNEGEGPVMEGGQASAPPSGPPYAQQQDYSSLRSYWQSRGRLSTGAFACLLVFCGETEEEFSVCARFVCHISACLRLMQMCRGGWEGQLHGKLLVLIQHVEQRRREEYFSISPPHPASPLWHMHTHTHERSHPTCVCASE